MLAPPYRKLGLFAGNLATCFTAGIGLERSLESTRRTLAGTKYQPAVDMAFDHIRNGADLSEALSADGTRWPPFFIPLIRAGEATGRLDEALRFLEHHCKLLDGPARAFQNAWMLPLCIMLCTSGLQIAIYLFGSPAHAFWFALSEIRNYVVLALFVFPLVAPPFRPLVDPLKLALPFVGAIERELSLSRFSRVMSLLYSAGGQRVESMIQIAARTVPNHAVRKDLMQSATEVKRGATIAEAFRAPTHLTRDEKDTIAAGDLAGTLELSFQRISDSTGEVVEGRLKLFQEYTTKVMFALGSISLAACVMRVVLMSRW